MRGNNLFQAMAVLGRLLESQEKQKRKEQIKKEKEIQKDIKALCELGIPYEMAHDIIMKGA